ncbi:MAG: PAS domain S-box protein, partial [Gemmatimonadaceae bacterium]|nr:PAS domain S-box protein [Gemmatimonadaceae bacterium]
ALRGEMVVPGLGFLFTTDEGREIWTNVAASPMRDAAGTVTGAVVVVRDIDDRKRGEALDAAQRGVLELVATGCPLSDVLAATCRLVQSVESGLRCAILLPDEHGTAVVECIAPDVPSSFCEAIAGTPLTSAQLGSCAQAFATGESVLVADVAADGTFAPEWRARLLAHGLRACRSIPVLGADRRVLASFAVHRDSVGDPLAPDARALDVATDLVGIAIARAQAAEQLRRSADEVRTLLDTLPVGVIFVHDPDSARLSGNRAVHDLLRLPAPAERAMADLAVEAMAHIDVQRDGIRLAPAQTPGYRAARGELIRNEAVDLRFPDGTVAHTLISAAPLVDGEGTTRGAVAAVQDVTGLRRAEREIRRNEERLRVALDSANMGTWEWHVPTGDVQWSETTRQLFGVAPDLPLSFLVFEGCLHPDDVESNRRWIADALRSGWYRQEYRIRRGGGIRWMASYGRLTRDAGGAPDRLLGVVLDVTERRLAEELLRERTRQLDFTLASTGIGMWHNRLPLGDLTWDARTHELFFVPRDVTPTIDLFWSRLHPDDRDPTREAMERALRDRTLFAIDHRVVAPDSGEMVWIRSMGQATYDALGRAVRFDGINYDITELKRREEALRDADRRKDEFLATLAHELRNPLAPLRNGLRIMALAGNDGALIERARSIMERQVAQMAHLIDDLMDLSRITRGLIVLQSTRLPLADAVQDAVDLARPLLEQRTHDLHLELPTEPLWVEGDRTRLSQIFCNLLNNAAKYTEPGGSIRLSVERRGTSALVRIIDTGVGIPAPMLTRIFDMFTQVDRSLEQAQGGLGIGLSIVKRLTEMHGGSIEATSDGPGRGSCFTVCLPLVAAPADADAASTGETPGTSLPRRRILVVDDNRDGAESLAAMLAIGGSETRTAHDGYSALSVAEAFRPDIIVMDIGMPRLNGLEACRRIR